LRAVVAIYNYLFVVKPAWLPAWLPMPPNIVSTVQRLPDSLHAGQ